jgi:hypothetical protein
LNINLEILNFEEKIKMKSFLILLFAIYFYQPKFYAQINEKRTYLEVNAGMARIFYDSYFPGFSFLIGQQKMLSSNTFLEYQVGLALPSIATGKIGLGYQNKSIGVSGGLRVFPSMLYGQIHFRTKKGQLNISAEQTPFNLNNWDLGPSFGANNVFTLGYQWNIGKSKR